VVKYICAAEEHIRVDPTEKASTIISTYFIELEELSTIETLISLKELSARGCVKLKKIRGLDLAKNLQMLDVTRCVELEEISSTETLVSLKWLCAGGCVKLKNIRGLGLATKLQLLDVSVCSELEDFQVWKHWYVWKSCAQTDV